MKQIGIITKPQGLKGEFRARIEGITKDNLKELTEIYINKSSYEIEKLTFREGFVIFQVVGINDCNQAEGLRNTPIFADFNETLDKDEVLIDDIIGFDVVLDNGEKLGKLKSVEDYGASEIFVVDGENEIMFPNAREVIIDFDMDNKKIILNSEILKEIRIDN